MKTYLLFTFYLVLAGLFIYFMYNSYNVNRQLTIKSCVENDGQWVNDLCLKTIVSKNGYVQ